MLYLVDTNILLRSSDPAHPMHKETISSIKTLIERDETIYIIPQNIIEYWGVATRPAENNGLGYTMTQVEIEISRILSLFALLEDVPAIFHKWRELLSAFSVKGKQVHDARIVAAMLVHGITNLISYNKHDFSRYNGIKVFLPSEII